MGAVTPPDDPLGDARRLGPEIGAAAPAIDRNRRIPDDLLASLHDARLFRMLLPRPFGGLETPPRIFLETIETVARHDGSTAWCLCQANGCAMAAAYLEADTAMEIWGDDPHAVLAWGPGRAEAREVDGGYRASGKLAFASGARHATWLGAHMPVIDRTGKARRTASGAPVLRTLLFRADSVELEDIWDTIGLRGTASDGYTLEDRFIPDAHTTVRDHAGHRRHGTPLYHFASMNLYAMGFAGTALGIAQGVFDAFVELAHTKTPRLRRSTLADDPLVQFELAQAAARLRAARAFLIAEVEEIWSNVLRNDGLDVAERVRIRLASTFAIHEAKGVVDTLYDAAGASAIFVSAPFERRFRDIHSVSQQLQGRRAHFQTVGAFLLGHPADMSVV